jgi:hypothetical protein
LEVNGLQVARQVLPKGLARGNTQLLICQSSDPLREDRIARYQAGVQPFQMQSLSVVLLIFMPVPIRLQVSMHGSKEAMQVSCHLELFRRAERSKLMHTRASGVLN